MGKERAQLPDLAEWLGALRLIKTTEQPTEAVFMVGFMSTKNQTTNKLSKQSNKQKYVNR